MVGGSADRSVSDMALEKIRDTMRKRRNIVQETRPLWSVAIVIAMIAVLASVLWYSYPKEAKHQKLVAAPIIRADAGAYKLIPEDPGGMSIPYRDSTIFDMFQTVRSTEGGGIEKLLSDDDFFRQGEKLFVGLKTDIVQESDVVEKTDAGNNKSRGDKSGERLTEVALADIPEPTTTDLTFVPVHEEIPDPFLLPDFTKSEKIILSMEEAPDIANADAVDFLIEASPKPYNKPEIVTFVMERAAKDLAFTEPAAGALHDNKGFYVQLGSLGSMEAAAREWNNLQRQFKDLASMGHRIQRADLGVNGTFYRVQAGPVAKSYARLLCNIVTKERPGTCLVVRN